MTALHAVDLIRKKRDGGELTAEEIGFLVEGAARETIPEEQLSAWLMAVFLRGMSLTELDTLTTAMRFSGEVLDHTGLGRSTVDKHSTGGVGDKTSFLVAPIAAAAGLADPMISGRALGHTGGTLDKLESIPGYRTALSLPEMRRVLERCGAAIVGQTKNLVPADRKLYSLRDRTATVENPYLICASIMSKKLAAGLDALVIDVKTGSGAFLREEKGARYLAALLVETGERAGTRTVAVLTDMSQPLGRTAGNWLEVAEAMRLLRNQRDPLSEDLREVSLVLAGWMIYLGGQARSAEAGYALAEGKLVDGSALRIFREMVAAQGGDVAALDAGMAFHQPKFRREFRAEKSGYFAAADGTKIGWAVQRLGAGRERAGDPVEAHAGLAMHAKLGAKIEAGQVLVTLFAEDEARFAEPEHLLRAALTIGEHPVTAPALVREIISADNKDSLLQRRNRP
ncbi:MAG TPA: thymidine phosphorylase [Acidobacteriaceae bacterium]|jgi:pyrimidine-nucleoside phosphorylase|nr:thymidine phosphorylase [Acidobacteriaceae bacterium]